MENTDNSPINELPKHKLDQESRIEMWSLIFLGLATLATAYAAWMGGVYGGNQSSYYMESNQKRAEGHASYLEAVNNSNNDSSVSKRINEIAVNYNIAKYYDDEQERLSCISATKLQFDLFSNSIYYELKGWEPNGDADIYYAEEWLNNYHNIVQAQSETMTQEEIDKTLHDAYFADAENLIHESDELYELGNHAGVISDKYNLVTVIYAIVLFLLGIIGAFKDIKKRAIIIIISVVLFFVTTVYMLIIPLL